MLLGAAQGRGDQEIGVIQILGLRGGSNEILEYRHGCVRPVGLKQCFGLFEGRLGRVCGSRITLLSPGIVRLNRKEFNWSGTANEGQREQIGQEQDEDVTGWLL